MSSLNQAEQQQQQQHAEQQQQQQQQQQMRTRVEQCGNQILRVRGDSDLDMEALFSVLHDKKCSTLPISSFKNRKLPASFFRPPDPKPCPHNSHDCGSDCAAVCKGLIHTGNINSTSTSSHAPVISHGRSMSSPVQLLHSHNSSPQHIRQSSMDGCTDEFSSLHPWDMATKCPKYHVKHWPQDLHSSYIPEMGLSQQQQHQLLSHHQHSICPGNNNHSMDLSKHQDLGPFPPGWEQGITPDGELYFINHIDKTTSWYDPRLPRHLQQQAAMGPVGGRHCQGHQPLEPQQVPQFPQQPDYLLQQQQQQQQLLPTSMPPSSMHPPPPPPPAPHSSSSSSGGRRPPPMANEQYLCIQLQKLQQEKERLQQEQEAIACREMMLNELVRHSATSSGSGDVPMKCLPSSCSLNPAGQGLQSPCGSGLDPFLGQVPSGVVESHVRQNSTDSGLGGMGTTYSLPRSPDDYLSNVEEMDLPDGSYKLPLPQNSCYNTSNMNLEVSTASDMTDILDNEHLISSLGEELENELFNEMDVQKINNLLWL